MVEGRTKMKKPKLSARRMIRSMLSFLLLFGVYVETGKYTVIALGAGGV
jgi:hypothetical protein